jgi:hypothetical protein
MSSNISTQKMENILEETKMAQSNNPEKIEGHWS